MRCDVVRTENASGVMLRHEWSGVAVLSGSELTEPGSPYSPSSSSGSSSSSCGQEEGRAGGGGATWPWAAPPLPLPAPARRHAGPGPAPSADAIPLHVIRKPDPHLQEEQLNIQQGRITEYFKAQMKPSTIGHKRDLTSWLDGKPRHAAESTKTDAAGNLEKYISYLTKNLTPRMLLDHTILERRQVEPPPKKAIEPVPTLMPLNPSCQKTEPEKKPLPGLKPILNVNRASPPVKKTDFNKTFPPSPDKLGKEGKARGALKVMNKRRRIMDGKKPNPKLAKYQHSASPEPGSPQPSANGMISSIHDHMRQIFMKPHLEANKPAQTDVTNSQKSSDLSRKPEHVPSVSLQTQTHNTNLGESPHRSETLGKSGNNAGCIPQVQVPVSLSMPGPPPPTTMMLTAIRIPQHGLQPQLAPVQSDANTHPRTANHISIASQTKLNPQFMLPMVQNINGALVQIPSLVTKVGQNGVLPISTQNMVHRQNNHMNQMFINGALLKINGPIHSNMSGLLTKQITASNSTNMSYTVTPKNMSTGVPTVMVSKPNFPMNHPIFVSSSGFILNPVGSVVTTQTSPGLSQMQQAFGGNVVFTTPMQPNVHISPHMNGGMSIPPGSIPMSPIKLNDINQVFLAPPQLAKMSSGDQVGHTAITNTSLRISDVSSTIDMGNTTIDNVIFNSTKNQNISKTNPAVIENVQQIVNSTTISNTNYMKINGNSLQSGETLKIDTFVMKAALRVPNLDAVIDNLNTKTQETLKTTPPPLSLIMPPLSDSLIPPLVDIPDKNHAASIKKPPDQSPATEEASPTPLSPRPREKSTDSAESELNKIENISLISEETKSSLDSISLDSNRNSDTPSIDSPITVISKDMDEESILTVSVSVGEEVPTCQKSPILSPPKTIRFPAKKHYGEARNRSSARSSASENKLCRWNDCSLRFDDSCDLLEHLQECHVNSQAGRETYTCLWQSCKVYNRPSCSRCWLERHVLSHGGNKLFRCIVDGCGLRFNTQLSLQRHVNNHFSEQNSNSSTARKSLEGSSGPKLIRRNGKKLRYRRQPWSARMFDYFDAGIMEGLQYRMVQAAQWRTAGGLWDDLYSSERGPHCITLAASVVARRLHADQQQHEWLVTWSPAHVLRDEWLLEKDFVPTKNVPILSLSPAAKDVLYSGFCASYRSPATREAERSEAGPSSGAGTSHLKTLNGVCEPVNGKIFNAHSSHNNNSKTDSLDANTANHTNYYKKCGGNVGGGASSPNTKVTGAAKRKSGRTQGKFS